jgi:Kef-type K+ transport system membrane component KefB
VTTGELLHFLLVLALLLSFAHFFGHAFARFRQPRVIGEILGGLVLGPTVLGALAPELHAALFPREGPIPAVIEAVNQLGLLLLMFASGSEMRRFFTAEDRKTVALTSLTGLVLPFVAAVAVLAPFDTTSLRGPAGTETSFLLVFGIAVAVTSIPVISRIMFDLGILQTPFARIVLGVAVVEDVVLYVLLAIALALAAGARHAYGLPALLGLEPSSPANLAYHVVATTGFLGVFLWLGGRLHHALRSFHYNLVERANDIAFHVVFMLGVTLIGAGLGVVPLFGAFVAGIIVATSEGESAVRARESIRSFSFAFFIPVYFAIVGLRLDLLTGFDPVLFLPFFAFACVVKAASVYLGARLAGEAPNAAVNLAVALNARGGPGIVLASVAFGAKIIDQTAYASLVMLAILTSLIAGSWLARVILAGRPLRGGDVDPLAEPRSL